MPNSVPFWVLIAVAFVTALLTNGLQIWLSIRNSNKNAKRAADAGGKVTEKLQEIHTLVNSEMTAARTQIADLRTYVANLERLLLHQVTGAPAPATPKEPPGAPPAEAVPPTP